MIGAARAVALLALASCAAPAAADPRLDEGSVGVPLPTVYEEPQLFYEPPGPGHPEGSLGAIVHRNSTTRMLGRDFYPFTIDTPEGEVVVELRTSANGPCGDWSRCPDEAEVRDVPPGTAAVPAFVETPEGGEKRMYLFEMVGF